MPYLFVFHYFIKDFLSAIFKEYYWIGFLLLLKPLPPLSEMISIFLKFSILISLSFYFYSFKWLICINLNNIPTWKLHIVSITSEINSPLYLDVITLSLLGIIIYHFYYFFLTIPIIHDGACFHSKSFY